MLIDFEKIGKNHWKNKCLMRLDDLGILDHPRFRRELSLLDHPGFRRELSRVDIKSSRFPSEIPIPIPTRLVKEKVLITGRRMYQSRLPFYNFYRRFDHLLTPLAEKTLDSYLWAERLHNDLNPGNILIAEMNDGRKRGIVIDFYSAGVSGHLFTDLVRLESLIIIEYLLNIDCKEKEIIEQIENRLFYLGDYRNTWLTRLFYSGDYRNTRLNQNLLNILDIAIKIRKIGIRWGIDLKQRDDTIYKNYLYAKYLFLISFQKISETDDSIRIKKDIALDFAIVLRDIIDKYEKREISVNLRELCRDSENLEPEGLLSQLRSRMHKANSIQELREIESKIEEFLHEHPHNSEATRLKDDVLKKQLSIFRRKMLEARSIELEQLLFEIDEFLHAHPYNAEARLLKKQVLTAIQKEKRESMDYRYMIPTSRKPGLIYQIAKALIAKALTAMAIIACLVFIILNLIPHSRASYPVIRSAYYNVKKQELNILTSGNHSKIKPDSLEFYARCEPGRADCFNGIQTPIKDGVHYIKNEPGCSACFHGVQTPIKNGVHYIKKCPDIDKCYKAVIQYTGLDGKDFKVVKEIEFRTSDGKESCEVEITTPDNSVVQDNNSLPIEESFSFTIQGKVKNLGSNKVCVYQKVPCGATWWRSGEPIGRDDLGPDGVWTMTYASCGKKGNPHSSCMVKAMVKEVCEPSDAEVSDLGDRICESATYTYKTKP
ncbi:MAG: hypothetical protein BWK80_48060 [Desulfobacteraceae bacterium IS3]|nr:MAG: hypothetical protein BWK80_48060 [Desulfobacteraceae bacterium IS3]